MANRSDSYAGSDAQNYWSSVFGDGYYTIGNHSTHGDMDGAVRFPGIVGTGNCVEADLFLHVDDNGGTSGTVIMNLYGIDEDNTSSFGSSPLGRTKTSASINWSQSVPSENTYTTRGVRDIVNEIRTRGGWSSGNALGFIFNKDGASSANAWFSGGTDDSPSSTITALSILNSSLPDFTPGPYSVKIGDKKTLAEKYGIRVVTDKESLILLPTTKNTIFGTNRSLLKVRTQGFTTVTNTKKINHLLPYTPAFLSYINDASNGRKYKLPVRMFLSKATGSEEIAYASTNATTIDFSVYEEVHVQGSGQGSLTREFYYYIFIDEI